MSRFWCVRHGPTHARAMVGWTDLPADLSDTAALARLDAYLPRDALLISSDLSRTRATADCLTQGRHRLPDDERLREIHFGAWEMARPDEIQDGPRLEAFWDEPGSISAPGGESWDDLFARVSSALDALGQAHAGRDIILVAHMGVIMAAIQAASDIPAVEAFSHQIDPLSVTDLALRPPSVGRINHNP